MQRLDTLLAARHRADIPCDYHVMYRQQGLRPLKERSHGLSILKRLA